MSSQTDRDWFSEHLATYLADGLSAEEKTRFETLATTDEACAAELNAAREMDANMTQIFADVQPSAFLNDRIIESLRDARRRWFMPHPAVRRAAGLTAAAVLLGAIGFVGSEWMERGHLSQMAFLDVDGDPVATASAPQQEHWFDKNPAPSDEPASIPVDRIRSRYAGEKPMAESGLVGGVAGYGLRDVEGVSKGGGGGGGTATELFAGRGGVSAKQAQMEERSGVILGSNEVRKSGAGPVQRFKPGEVTVANGATLQLGGQVLTADGRAVLDLKKGVGSPTPEDSIMLHRGVEVAEKPKELAQVQGQAHAERDKPANQPVEQPKPVEPAPVAPMQNRKIIRNGSMEFEVDSFDSAYTQVSKIVTEEGGFIATTDSNKLPNGAVRGVVTVRVSPDRLDTLVLKLRALGDLKSQKLSADDITKQYVDLESQLRAARAMEERLLQMIKDAKGAIKDLLAAEKELGVWRVKIEELQGTINYYNNLVSLSTLTITIAEKDVKTPTAASETEQANVGVETEDVEKARAEALKAVDDAKGRIIESDLKRHEAGQLAARLVADVPPDRAGEVIDRLKQLGRVARLDVQRKQVTQGGQGAPTGVKVDRKDTRLIVSLYNLANVAPRQTVNMNVAADDVEGAYRALLGQIEKMAGKVVTSSLNRQSGEQTTASVNFETPVARAEESLQAVRQLGEAMRMDVTENPDTANVTTAKRGFVVQLYSQAQVQPRETVTMQLAAADVSGAFNALRETTLANKGRIHVSQLSDQNVREAMGSLHVDVPRASVPLIDKAIASAGDVVGRSAERSSDLANTLDSKVRLQISVINIDRVPPKETTSMRLEVGDVDGSLNNLTASVLSAGGRILDSRQSRDSSGANSGKLTFDVPIQQAGVMLTTLKNAGALREISASRSSDLPAGTLSRSRFVVDIGDAGAIVSADRGVLATIRNGLTTSVKGLLFSLQFIVIGLCFVLPWAIVLWAAAKIIRRRRASPT